MKRLLVLLILSTFIVECFAQGKVKGELRTEINGFQWYCHNGKEAYTKDGIRLFPNIKASKIEYVLSKGYYKEKDKGCFRVEIDKYINVDVGDHKSKMKVWNYYSSNGKLIKEGVLGGSRYGIGSIENPVFYLCVMCGPFSFSYHSIEGDGTKQYIAEGHIMIIDDNGVVIESNLKQRNETLEQVTVLTEGKYDETKEVLGLWYRTNSNTSCLITEKGGKIELNGVWSFSIQGNCFYAEKDGLIGVMDNDGSWVVPYGYSKVEMMYSSGKSFYNVQKDGLCGLINSEGKVILPAEMEIIQPINTGDLKYKKGRFWGIMNTEGENIIPISRGYNFIGDYDSTKGTFAFTKKGYTGFCDAQGKEISLTKLPPTADDIKADGGYASAVELMNGSTKYYKVSKGGKYGLTDAEGRVIIPCEMEALESAGTGFLRFKLNGFYGIVNYAGKILIPTDRGYTKIGDYVSFTKRFPYEMDGWKGECNNLGVQVSKIKVATPVAQDSSTTLSSTSAENVIDFIFDLYMKQTEGETFIPIPRMPEKENNSLVWEYIVRIELNTNSINYKIMLVDRMPDYKTEVVESYSLTPSSSIFAVTDERMQIAVDESGVYKGLQLDKKGVITIGKWRNDKFIDGWFFVPFSLYRDLDGELGENYAFQEVLLKGINENKNFEHAQIGETDFNGKYNKLKAALQKYNWSKVVKK